MRLPFQKNDGGRSAAGFKGEASDCVVRSIAIATGLEYQFVYDELFLMNRKANRKHPRGKASPRDAGTSMETVKAFLGSLGWRWVPCMKIGSGCKVHLASGELPDGNLIVRVSKHMVAVIDGVIQDTHDCGRDGTRCVYGYFQLKGEV